MRSTSLPDSRRRSLLIGAVFMATAFVMLAQLPSTVSFMASLHGDRLDGSPPDAYEDYIAFYAAGRLVLEGDAGDLYDVDRIAAEETQAAGRPVGETGVLPFFNPPFAALLFAPFAALPLEAFATLLLAFNLALVAGACLLLDRFLGLKSWPQRAFVVLAFVTLNSVAWVLNQGQLSMVLFYGWLGFVWFERQGKPAYAGASLALLLIKPQMALLPLAYLLVKGGRKELAGFAAPAAAMAIASLLLAGPAVLFEYPRFALESTGWYGDGVHTRIMYGWNSFLVWTTGRETASMGLVLLLDALTIAVVGMAVRRLRPGFEGLATAMSLLLAASLLVNPHLYLQELVLVPLILAFRYAGSPADARSVVAWGTLACLFWGVNLVARMAAPLPGPVLFQLTTATFIAVTAAAIPAAATRPRPAEAEQRLAA